MKKNFVFSLSMLLNVILVFVLAFFALTRTSILDSFIGSNPQDFESDMYVEAMSKFDEVSLDKVDVVFVGNSIVGRGLWNEYFFDLVVANRGIGTDTTFGMLNRIEQVISFNPDKVFISGGINDLTNGYELDVILENYDSIFNKFKSELPNSVINVQSVLPIQEDKRNVKNELIATFNEKLQKLAEQYSYRYIDIYSEFIDESGQLKEEYTIDGTHLTGAGYAHWVDLIDDFVYEHSEQNPH